MTPLDEFASLIAATSWARKKDASPEELKAFAKRVYDVAEALVAESKMRHVADIVST